MPFFFTLYILQLWIKSIKRQGRGLQHFCVQKQNTLHLRTKGTKPKTICSQRMCPVRVPTNWPLLTNMAHKCFICTFTFLFKLEGMASSYVFYSVVITEHTIHTIKLHTDLFLKSVLLSKEEPVDGGTLSPDPGFVAPVVTCHSFSTSYSKLCHTVECQQCAKYRV